MNRTACERAETWMALDAVDALTVEKQSMLTRHLTSCVTCAEVHAAFVDGKRVDVYGLAEPSAALTTPTSSTWLHVGKYGANCIVTLNLETTYDQ